MSVDLPSMLADRADGVEPPQIDPLGVVVQGERLLRRRHRLAAAGAALAVVATVGATSVLVDPDRAVSPAPPVENVRPLTYGQGTVLHRGDQAFDTGLSFLTLDIVDGGAMLTTLDGRIWFSDGTDVLEVGKTRGGRVHGSGVAWTGGRPPGWVATGSTGSLAAWLEYPAQPAEGVELVVYDAAERTVVARQALRASRLDAAVAAVAEDEIFVHRTASQLYRYTVGADGFSEVDEAAFDDAVRAVDRVLVHGSSAAARDVVGSGGTGGELQLYDRYEVRDSSLPGLYDPRTGERVEMRLPDSYEYADTYAWFVQWLDDNRFAVLTGASGRGDLLTCRIDVGRCTLTIDESTWLTSVPPIIPGHGAVGSEYALGDAMREPG